jgi:hypothetical protein
MQYVEAYPDSSIARDYNRAGLDMGGHFATCLFENRLNDAWYHADFNNMRRMLYLGFRNNMYQSFKDCTGLECKLDDTRFVNDLVRLIIHLDKKAENIGFESAKIQGNYTHE